MHTKLQEILAKKNLKEEDLTPEERHTYDNWNRVLSNEKITIETVREFCNTQKQLIEAQWSNLDNTSQKNDRLILLHTVYSKIAKVTEADKAEREALEVQLNNLLTQDT